MKFLKYITILIFVIMLFFVNNRSVSAQCYTDPGTGDWWYCETDPLTLIDHCETTGGGGTQEAYECCLSAGTSTCEAPTGGGGGGGPERQGDINCPAGTVVDYNQPLSTVCSSQEQGYYVGNAQQITGCCREVTIKGACEWISEWKQGKEVLRKECAPDETNCAQNYYTTYACVPICDPNDWGAWSACSASCGPGTQSRTNACGTPQSQSCQVNDPNIWGAWSTCTVNCGGGTQDRTNQCGTSQTQNCNTQVCGPWIKLKDSSFISANNLFNMISSIPDPYDDDDTTEQFFIVGNDRVVAAPVINLDISNVAPTAKTGNPEYKALYTPTYSMTPALFLSYVKARKEYKVITNLGEISGSGIYVFNGDVSIDSASSPFNGTGNIVLLSTGTVTVSRVAPSTTFTPGGSAAIIAPTINFNGNLTEATGIFIGNTVSTGTNATQGLKIIGNLIAQTTLSNNREWPTTARPSLFIKFDQTKYINLFPYLSTASYQWREVIINQRFAETCQVLHFYSLPTSTEGSPKSGGQIIRRLCSGGVLL